MSGEAASALREVLGLLSPGRLVASALVLLATWGMSHALRVLLALVAERIPQWRVRLLGLFPVLRLALWLLAVAVVVFVVLQPAGSALLALAASAGLALGLALQDAARNLVAGVFVLYERPFRVGDVVRVAGHEGEVEAIDPSVTRLRSFDDSLVTIPNAVLLREPVENANVGGLQALVAVDLDLPAAADVAEARRAARDAAEGCPLVALERPISVLVSDRHDVVPLTRLTVKAYVVDVREQPAIASELAERVKTRLAAGGLLEAAPAQAAAP